MVLSEVPPYSTVVGIPGRVVKREEVRLPRLDLDQTHLPDPVLNDLNILKQENEELKIAFKKLVDRVEKAERNNKNV